MHQHGQVPGNGHHRLIDTANANDTTTDTAKSSDAAPAEAAEPKKCFLKFNHIIHNRLDIFLIHNYM